MSVEPTDWTSEIVEAMRVERSRLQAIPGADADVVFGDPRGQPDSAARV